MVGEADDSGAEFAFLGSEGVLRDCGELVVWSGVAEHETTNRRMNSTQKRCVFINKYLSKGVVW